MFKYLLTAILVFLSLFDLLGQQKHVFSQKAKAAFNKLASPESTLKWITVNETEKVSKNSFLSKSKEIFDLDEKTTFQEIRVVNNKNKLNATWNHYRLQQMYNGIPIENAQYLLHEKNGLIETANGNVVPGLKINTTPAISEKVALEGLLKEINANKYVWENEHREEVLKAHLNDPNATNFPKGKLVIVSKTQNLEDKDYVLGYKFKIETISPFSLAEYVVDASTGTLVYKNSLLCQNDVLGTCETHSYGNQTITMNYDNAVYTLKDNARNIETINGSGQICADDGSGQICPNIGIHPLENDAPDWDIHQSGCEGHWAAEMTYDYLENKHDWTGYDNANNKLQIWVYMGDQNFKAKGGSGNIYLGEGDGVNFGPYTSIDIVAHEFMHSVIQSTANLQYARESGALNESFADIFGTMVEFYAEPNPNNKDWLFGEDNSLMGDSNAIRDLSNPNSKDHPNTYKDDYWEYTEMGCNELNDYCHVHTNSGVQNHWFYILSMGSTGTNFYDYNYDVAGIGMESAAEIAFENLRCYLSPCSDYMEARKGAIEAAVSLGYSADTVIQVMEAWNAVGVSGNCDNSVSGDITLIYPNGQETLNQGIIDTIRWTSNGYIGDKIKIEYSVNAGNQWQTITEETTNDGSFEWIPPSIQTNLAMIRVSSACDNTIFDFSDGCFSINTCDLEASFTVSNEQPCAGENVTFSSTTPGNLDYFDWYISGLFVNSGEVIDYNFYYPGSYLVELCASNGIDCGDVASYYIDVEPKSDADFDFNVNDNIVRFQASENTEGATYTWNFGSGSYTTPEPIISNIYIVGGTYNVCLTVNSNCGSDTECKNVSVEVIGCSNINACNYNPLASDNSTCVFGDCNYCIENDSLALVDLYNSTNGPNWTVNWNLNDPVDTWHGITTDGCRVTNIDLSENNLIGTIPNSIGSFVALDKLFLNGNVIHGFIAESIGSLKKLKRLNLSDNYLTGSIPDSLFTLYKLEKLYLGNNILTGNIPSNISSMTNLYTLDISANSIDGSIPPQIGYLSNLETLKLNNNNISGSIPNSIGLLQNLDWIYLQRNNLVGTIPPQLYNITGLKFLNIQNNRLKGKIDNDIHFLTNLEYLNLSNNFITNKIPSSILYMKNIRILNLENNSFFGEIPKEIGLLEKLEEVIFSDNNFTGLIPKEIGNLLNLRVLHLENNNLLGEIPVELGNLSNLTELRFNSNYLTGCYPVDLCNLNLDPSYFNFEGNAGLIDGGSDQGFIDFCNGNDVCSGPDVYPGDLNFDGRVDNKDILSIGLFNGDSGPSREENSQNTEWYGHKSRDWGQQQTNGADLKHIDANGNGIIDLEDFDVIDENYYNTHFNAPNSNLINCFSDSTIEVSLLETPLPSNNNNNTNELVFDINITTVDNSNLGIYGSCFTIGYDHPEVSNIEIEIIDSTWFGQTGLNLINIYRWDPDENRVEVGITRVDGLNSVKGGLVGNLIVTIDNDPPGDSNDYSFYIEDIDLRNAQMRELPITTAPSVTIVSKPDCLPSLNVVSDTVFQNSNVTAQGLIQTNGNTVVNANETVSFSADQFKINNGFTVEDGAEFTFFNDPCGIANRNSGSRNFTNPNQIFRSGSYKIIENELVFEFDLVKGGAVSFEIINSVNNAYKFGKKSEGSQTISIPIEEVQNNEFRACFKVGFDRYYFDVKL